MQRNYDPYAGCHAAYSTSAKKGINAAVQITSTRRKAIRLAKEPTVNFYELASVIVDLHDVDAMQHLAEDTGMSRRRLYYLLEVGQFIERWGISEAATAKVGWTKLQIISRHAGHDQSKSAMDIEAYLEAASATTAYALSTTLRQGRAVPKKAVVFRLNVGAKAEIREALAAFGAKSRGKGLILKEKALMKIVRTAMSIRA